MAFLDNSGDIILDATLTELGRKRMANGTFSIIKFAFGDDEINYELYNKDHASGSAYYDLEIMQTPVFEASTGDNAKINYGLMSLANNGLLYLPTIKRNQKVRPGAKPVSNVYYLAVNDAVTADALEGAFGGSAGGGDLKVLRAGKTDGTAILLETGLDTTEIAATSDNRVNFITANGLVESNFTVSVDRRFFSTVLGPGGSTTFNNNGPSGESNVNVSLAAVAAVTQDLNNRMNNTATIPAVSNAVVKRLTDTKADTATSVIAGPRASFTAINFNTKLLTADDYSRYGKTGQSIAGAAGTYRYIDTTVKVLGSTGITEQLPIRIIQKE
tara:strand:+ start:1289 stop:2275 length:987 start_codon:yes stop_codon:yes gene_type:complete